MNSGNMWVGCLYIILVTDNVYLKKWWHYIGSVIIEMRYLLTINHLQP